MKVEIFENGKKEKVVEYLNELYKNKIVENVQFSIYCNENGPIYVAFVIYTEKSRVPSH